jgi:oxygen-independent coproporphyrinogen III oxidase
VDSLYFGGGTPSIMNTDFFEQIIELFRYSFSFISDIEVTVEINPESANFNKLTKLKALGVNRASLGSQSFDNNILKKMNRVHTEENILEAVKTIREAGFSNLSMDLITGYPDQTAETMTRSLKKLVDLKPEHTSIYRLELKPGSYLEYQIENGEVPPVDEQFIEDFYQNVCSILEENQYERYEMSSFTRPGFACQHNLKFWQDKIFLGFGAGAQGMTGRMRYANLADLDSYFDAVEYRQPPYIYNKKMSPETRFKVAIIQGSYLVKGVDLNLLSERYHVDSLAFIEYSIRDFIEEGHIEITNDNILKVTSSGRSDLNKIFTKWA